jgi:type III restriction enzyme
LNEPYIEWWYKNGDNGKEHFAIPYNNLQDELRLFYVDFVVKFKSGSIGLFDTKTKRSDADAPKKHNALIAYMETENQTKTNDKLFGGVLILTETNGSISFRYCSNTITDTNDLTGWGFLDPSSI